MGSELCGHSATKAVYGTDSSAVQRKRWYTYTYTHTHTYTHIHSWLGYVMKQRNEEWNRQFSFVIRHKIIDICSVSE